MMMTRGPATGSHAAPRHLRAITTHARRGALRNAFRYGVDYVLIDPDCRRGPLLFGRNRFNLASVSDRDHGGARGAGRGAAWARDQFAAAGMGRAGAGDLRLLTQPRFAGFGFNPVSFWLWIEGGALKAVIAEVNNTFGDRHSYLCCKPDLSPIDGSDEIRARKVFHVSPFQQIAGEYRFTFDIRNESIAIRIAHENGAAGVVATLTGTHAPLTSTGLALAALRRPFGPLRVLALIYWQALRLRRKGAVYRPRPLPPQEEISQ